MTPKEIELQRSWETLNRALDRRVPVSVQMRVTACVQDTLSFVPLLRDLEAAEARRNAPTTTPADYEWDSQLSFQFAAAFKATYYFLRALQDAVYAALLEASGQRAGTYSSMNDCAKKRNNPIHALVAEALPEYFDWFVDLRRVRNDMKFGISTAFGFSGHPGSAQVRIIRQNINDVERRVSSGRELSVGDIDRCLAHSAQLLQFAADYVNANPNTADPV